MGDDCLKSWWGRGHDLSYMTLLTAPYAKIRGVVNFLTCFEIWLQFFFFFSFEGHEILHCVERENTDPHGN